MMQRWRRWQERLWFVPILVVGCYVLVACDGGTPKTNIPSQQVLDPSLLFRKGQPVYLDGMPGILQRSLDLLPSLSKEIQEGKLHSTSFFPWEEIRKRSQTEHAANLHYFTETEADMRRRQIPEEIIQRLLDLRSKYLAEYQVFSGHLDRLLIKPSLLFPPQVEAFRLFLKKSQPVLPSKKIDLQRLPHQRAKAHHQPPMTTAQEYAQAWGLPLLPSGVPIALPAPEDTAETKDIRLSPGIKALAAQLQTPLAIYKWIHDQIQFHPTYGSIQGADYCRQTKRCNAFDTASLLIALLRAQKIPARYVFGTVEIPLAAAQNWVGRFDAEKGPVGRALASGGIPAVSLFSGSKVTHIRLEHVWVEAWVDYVPSRGAIHQEGDTWIPLDPTYKQHDYTAATSSLLGKTGVDGPSTISTAKAAVQEDTVGGFTQGPSPQAVLQAAASAQTKTKTDLQGQTFNFGDLLGKKAIRSYSPSYLLASLPYTVTTIGQRLASIPDRLRHTVKVSVTTDVAPEGSWGFGGDGPPDFTWQSSLPEIIGQSFALAYDPASPADRIAMERYLPTKRNPGDPAPEVKDYVKSLPAVFQLKPSLLLGGKEVSAGKATRIGSDNRLLITFQGPGIFQPIENTIVAGSYQAIVINPVRIATEQFEEARKKADALRTELKASNATNLDREASYGAFLFSAGLGYWTNVDAQNRTQAEQFGILDIRLPSVGLFSYGLDVTYSGFIVQTPSKIDGGRVETDIDHDLHAIVSYTDNHEDEVNYFARAGLIGSAWEGAMWEVATFGGSSRKPDPNRGISAYHMMLYANQTGVPVYTIRKDNLAAVLPKLTLDASTINAIRSAVAAGKTVITAARVMIKEGWKGVGYIIMDEQTGAGAYMISGGKSGGGGTLDSIPTWLSFLLGIFMLGAAAVGSFGFGVALAVIGILMALYDMYATYTQIDDPNRNLTPEQREGLRAIVTMMALLAVVIGVLGIWFGAFGGFIAVAIAIIIYSIIVSAIISAMMDNFELINQRNQNLP